MPVILVGVALLGLAIGSFLNVVIYRLPLGQSLSHPASHCPRCDAPIRARHNIPVLGWLFLRGRCKDCRAPISVRYPLVELITGLLFVALAVRMDQLHRLSALPAYLIFAAVGVALTMIDLDCHRLPNSLVLPCYPVIGLALIVAALTSHHPGALARAAVGAAALFAFYLALAFAYPAGMGLGDVKLSGVLGMLLGYLSYATLLVGAVLPFLLGGVIGSAIIISRHGNRKTAIPFGPFMIAGALTAIFFAAPLADLYRHVALGTS